MQIIDLFINSLTFVLMTFTENIAFDHACMYLMWGNQDIYHGNVITCKNKLLTQLLQFTTTLQVFN